MKIFAAICLFSILLQLAAAPGYMVDYMVNYDAYLENCENKDKPEMNCNGHCLLMQKIKDSNEKNDAADRQIQIRTEYIPASRPFKVVDNVAVKASKLFFIDVFHLSNLISRIFHPPKF